MMLEMTQKVAIMQGNHKPYMLMLTRGCKYPKRSHISLRI